MKSQIKRIAGLVAMALILSALAGFTAAMAEDAYAMVVARNARLYANQDLSGKSAKMPKYAIVALAAKGKNVVKVEYKGYTGYMEASAVGEIDTSTYIEAVFSSDARVYELATTASKSAKVSAGTAVKVLLAANGCALVEKNGVFAYTRVKNLAAAKPDEPAEKPRKNEDVVIGDVEAIVTDSSVNVYASTKSGAKVIGKLSKDTVITVTAYNSALARISYGGGVGYCLVSGLSKYIPPEPTAKDVFSDSSLSSEEKIYYFLIYEIGLNPAGASGVLANIDHESGFRATAVNSSSGAYGICQWLGGRKTNLQKFCADNGYDHATLEGQLWYLKYELENKYPSVFKYVKAVDDSAQGAYDAGYHWCYYFEIPGNRTGNSIKRGALARDSYWPAYK